MRANIFPIITTVLCLLVLRPSFAQNFAKTVDLQPLQISVKNQGPRDTCVYFAVNALIESTIKKLNGVDYDISEEYQIFSHKVLKPWRPEVEFGNTYELMQSFVASLHFYTEEAIPYRTQSPLFDQSLPQEWLDLFEKQKSDNRPVQFRSLKVKALSKMWSSRTWSQIIVDELNQERPVVVTLKVSQKHIDDTKGLFTYNAEIDQQCLAKQTPCGGHAVLLVGYDEEKKIFKFKNSWGANWGHNGYGFATFDHINQFSDQPLTAYFDKLLDPWVK